MCIKACTATLHSTLFVTYVKNKILVFCKTDKMKKFLALHTPILKNLKVVKYLRIIFSWEMTPYTCFKKPKASMFKWE